MADSSSQPPKINKILCDTLIISLQAKYKKKNRWKTKYGSLNRNEHIKRFRLPESTQTHEQRCLKVDDAADNNKEL